MILNSNDENDDRGFPSLICSAIRLKCGIRQWKVDSIGDYSSDLVWDESLQYLMLDNLHDQQQSAWYCHWQIRGVSTTKSSLHSARSLSSHWPSTSSEETDSSLCQPYLRYMGNNEIIIMHAVHYNNLYCSVCNIHQYLQASHKVVCFAKDSSSQYHAFSAHSLFVMRMVSMREFTMQTRALRRLRNAHKSTLPYLRWRCIAKALTQAIESHRSQRPVGGLITHFLHITRFSILGMLPPRLTNNSLAIAHYFAHHHPDNEPSRASPRKRQCALEIMRLEESPSSPHYLPTYLVLGKSQSSRSRASPVLITSPFFRYKSPLVGPEIKP